MVPLIVATILLAQKQHPITARKQVYLTHRSISRTQRPIDRARLYGGRSGSAAYDYTRTVPDICWATRELRRSTFTMPLREVARWTSDVPTAQALGGLMLFVQAKALYDDHIHPAFATLKSDCKRRH
jgi:hypothetical protein